MSTRTWLALLLFLQVIVHPFLHTVPLLATPSGQHVVAAPAAENYSGTHDCELCRIATGVVRVVGFAAPQPCNSSLQFASETTSTVLGTTQFRLSSRAPPAS